MIIILQTIPIIKLYMKLEVRPNFNLWIIKISTQNLSILSCPDRILHKKSSNNYTVKK